MKTWTKFENAFLSNDLTRNFLEKWIQNKGAFAPADELEAAFKSLRASDAQRAFADLVVEIHKTFREETRRQALSNLKDNSPAARKARVEAFIKSNPEHAQRLVR